MQGDSVRSTETMIWKLLFQLPEHMQCLNGHHNWKTGQVKAVISGWRKRVEEWKIIHSHCKPVAFFFPSREARNKHSVFWSSDLLRPMASKLCQLWGPFLASTSQLISQGGTFITCLNCSNQCETTGGATTRPHSLSATRTFKPASWKG